MENKKVLNKQQQEFQFILSRFSHEIRNPVSLLNSELQMIAASHPEVTAYTYWGDVLDNLEYMKELLNTLSDYSNAGTLSLQSTQMEEYLNKVLSGIQPVLEYLSISLETDISPELPFILVDTVKLRQSLLNLLRNAEEAISGPNGKIIALCHNKIKWNGSWTRSYQTDHSRTRRPDIGAEHSRKRNSFSDSS